MLKFLASTGFTTAGIKVDSRYEGITAPFVKEVSRGFQGFKVVSDSSSDTDTVGQPVMHLSAPLQATGEACYLDDIPKLQGELYAAVVTSSRAHAKISVDYGEAVKMEGVCGYVGATEDAKPFFDNITGTCK